MFKKIIFFSFFLSVQINGMQNSKAINTRMSCIEQNCSLYDFMKTVASKLSNIKFIDEVKENLLSDNFHNLDKRTKIIDKLMISNSILCLLCSIINTQEYIKRVAEGNTLKDSFNTIEMFINSILHILEGIQSETKFKIAQGEIFPSGSIIFLEQYENTKQILELVNNKILLLKNN